MILSQPLAFGLTLLVEGVVAAGLAPVFHARRGRAVLAALGGSTLTHPIVWAGAYALYRTLRFATVPALEAFAIAAEAVGYRWLAVPRWRDAVLLSALVNGASWGVGALLQARW